MLTTIYERIGAIMMDHRQEELLRKILTESSPVLFLGAGFPLELKMIVDY